MFLSWDNTHNYYLLLLFFFVFLKFRDNDVIFRHHLIILSFYRGRFYCKILSLSLQTPILTKQRQTKLFPSFYHLINVFCANYNLSHLLPLYSILFSFQSFPDHINLYYFCRGENYSSDCPLVTSEIQILDPARPVVLLA
jgi:hypothetical protein